MYPLKILILEDDPDDLLVIERTLGKSPYFESEHVSTDNAGEYTRLMDTFLPDVILADYRLPQFSGLEALRICLEKNPTTPFIFVTGAIGEELAAETVLNGAWGFILKENIGKLNQTIDQCINKLVEEPQLETLLSRISTSYRLQKQIETNNQVLANAKKFLQTHPLEAQNTDKLRQKLEDVQQEIQELKDEMENK